MTRALLALVCGLALVPVAGTPAQAAPPGFVTRSGTGFVLDGQPFRFGGTNNYYLHYKSSLMVDDVLNDAQAANLEVIRSWAFLECGGDRPNSAGGCSQGPDAWLQRWSNAANGPVYNTGPGGLPKLDYLLAQAAARGQKVILVLTNNWRDFGGMDQYVTWYGLQYHDQFYTDARIRQAYKNFAAQLVNRMNPLTGVRYRDDPTIFSWELANEPRCINASLPTSGTCTADTLVSWAGEMSTHLKSIDPNHLVSVGDEGFHPGPAGPPGSWPYNVTDGVDHARLTALPAVDFGTYHLYPDHWSQPDSWGTGWIADHNAVGGTLGKPEVLEEFGVTGDAGRKDAAYRPWTAAVASGGGDGWLVWILTGIQDDGSLYPDYDGFRVVWPSPTATLLSDAARAIGGGGADTTPPTPPGTPAASGVTATSLTLTWSASTDNVAVTGYEVLAGTTVVATSATTTAPVTGLAPATTYTFAVVARDAAGNVSPRSGSVTVTTATGGAGSCRVEYGTNTWNTGFTAYLTITNTGTTAVDGWTLRFTFPAGQRLGHGWSATWEQTTGSAEVTARSLDWNRVVAPNTSIQIGFNGSHTGTNPEPTTFTLNGTTCTTV